MSNSRFETLAIALIVLGSCLATGVPVQAQSPAPAKAQAPAVPRVAATRAPTTPSTSQAEIQAEREEIWNSPDMLRARAWLKDYCSKSAKVTPEMAKQYEAELANMSPNQMRLWLMKFDEQEQYRQQQYAVFQQQNTNGLQQAMAVHKQTQQAYSALNQAETASAQGEQQQINTQRAAAQSEQENKELEQSNPYPYYGNGGYAPYGFGGGAQYHYHFYGN